MRSNLARSNLARSNLARVSAALKVPKMSLFSAIKSALANEKKETNADMAKQRLHLLLISDRAGLAKPDFLPQLRLEIIEVLKKYIPIVDNEDVEIKYDGDNAEGTHILEMSVSLEGSDAQRLNLTADTSTKSPSSRD